MFLLRDHFQITPDEEVWEVNADRAGQRSPDILRAHIVSKVKYRINAFDW